MSIEKIVVPDVGSDQVELVEVSVSVGDTVEIDETLVVLETDKASMEIPSTFAGVITEINCAEGDKLSQGDALVSIEIQAEAQAEPEVQPEPEVVAAPAVVEAVAEVAVAAPATVTETNFEMLVPDIGGEAEVVEISVAVGDTVAIDDMLCVLESDKASMEVPAPKQATVLKWLISEGDKVSEGAPMVLLSVTEAAAPAPEKVAEPVAAAKPAAAAPAPKAPEPAVSQEPVVQADGIYAGPLVRKLAREMGVNLSKVTASGAKGRISKDDVKAYVKAAVNQPAAVAGGSGIPTVPEQDFAEFGSVRIEKMSKIHKLTAENMHRSWLNVPHVTQFDDVDITELEAFRKSIKAEALAAGVKLSPLPFLIKAVTAALAQNPTFNASLHADGEHIVFKDYINIGIAVDTPAGLMVPVIKDADKMGLYELSEECARLATAAKERKLKPAEMKGGCFTISSLGGIGGKGFTPIVNTPEVAILGVSRLSTQPVWNGSEFLPRQMLPLSLSYDHRAINGSDAGRFFADLSVYLADVRRLLL